MIKVQKILIFLSLVLAHQAAPAMGEQCDKDRLDIVALNLLRIEPSRVDSKRKSVARELKDLYLVHNEEFKKTSPKERSWCIFRLIEVSEDLPSCLPYCYSELNNYGENGFSKLPDSLSPGVNFHELSELDLVGIGLIEFPEPILCLTLLLVLSLDCNFLKRLPQNIGRLKNLRELNLACNNLRTLPRSIGCLADLKLLNLRVNELEKLPAAMKNLSRLHWLDLSHNRSLRRAGIEDSDYTKDALRKLFANLRDRRASL